MKKNIKWGIIGCGTIANFFVTSLRRLESCEIVAVAARDYSRAKEFADKYRIHTAYGSYTELVNDSNVDAIYIATPHAFHCEHILLCLNANKPVLCEKAFVTSAKQAKEVFTVAKQKNLALMEAFWTRFIPAMKKAKELIRSEKYGKLTAVKADLVFNFLERSDENRAFNPNLAGGALLDVGVYPLTAAIFMLGSKPDSIVATSKKHKTGVDLSTATKLMYGNISCDLYSSFGEDTSNFIKYFCENATLVLNGSNGPNILTVEQAGKVVETFEYASPNIEKGTGFEFEIEEFNNLLRSGKITSEVMSDKESIALMEILDICREQIGLVYPFD